MSKTEAPPDPAPLEPAPLDEHAPQEQVFLMPELAADAGSMEMPMLRLELAGAQINIARHPETGDRAMIVGPVLLQIILPLDAENARLVGRELVGGIEIANSIPPEAASRIVRR